MSRIYKGVWSMAEKKPRATREESIKAKIEANLAAQAKTVEKLEELKAVEAGLKEELDDIKSAARKAEKAAERAAKKAAREKAEKDLMKAIKKSGLSLEDVKDKLGI